MTEHISDAEIEAFALGELLPPRLAGFEAHVSSCDECAGRLAAAARLELALAEVQAASASRARRRVSRRTVGAAAATLTAAAAVLLLFLRDIRDQPVPSAIGAGLVCADGPGQVACVRRAQRHGLLVHYPDWAGPPPFGQRDISAGPSVAPFPYPRPTL
jgi:anti-sigma factor RsiW